MKGDDPGHIRDTSFTPDGKRKGNSAVELTKLKVAKVLLKIQVLLRICKDQCMRSVLSTRPRLSNGDGVEQTLFLVRQGGGEMLKTAEKQQI